ncbi:DUF397 domain-containing protein [Streptomyces sp. NPDC053048]|uniref:DUF397 domain-containing protein n=1 Tax=Streptomyces sp. NPDC053048 TaxID=3365694 RepID=UPI0037D4C8A4
MRANLSNAVIWQKSSYSNPDGGACVEVGEAAWRKSSYSNPDGGECVEVGEAAWRKSTYSAGQEDCLEVADNIPSGTAPAPVPVRDSKRPAGPALLFQAEAWSAFVATVKKTR